MFSILRNSFRKFRNETELRSEFWPKLNENPELVPKLMERNEPRSEKFGTGPTTDCVYRKTIHKLGPLLQTEGHPFPLLLGQPSSAFLSTAHAGSQMSVKKGWATKTIIFEDVRGHKLTSFFTCKLFGQFAVLGIFSAHFLVKIIRNSPRKIGATK